MTPLDLENLEFIRGMLSACTHDLISVNNRFPSREVAIASKHASEAIKALNFFLNGKPTTYAEPESRAEMAEFTAGLNSGTDS